MELDQVMQERETTEPDPDMWRWSPLELSKFDEMLALTIRLALSSGLRRLFFAEAGSGIGTKLYLAKNYYGLDVTGYEISTDYLSKAEKLGVNSIEWDLRRKHPPWSHFDIVYTARPFKSDEYEVQWEREVMELMRPGTFLISAYAAVKPYGWPCYYRRPFRGVWMKPPDSKTSAPRYTDMIERQQPHDPLVPEPGP